LLKASVFPGAYGFTMSSNYNTRPRVAEVMVANTTHQLVRKRETITEQFNGLVVILDGFFKLF
jgi:diaminopimelate decarboxylase